MQAPLYSMKRRYTGLFGSAKAWLLSSQSRDFKRILLVCKDRKIADDLKGDLEFFLPDRKIVSLPAWDTLPFESVSPQVEISAERIASLAALHTAEDFLVVTPAEALCQKILPFRFISDLSLTLKRGDNGDKEDIKRRLEEAGFVPVRLVEEIGDYAIRGHVVDIFSSTLARPVRIELSEAHEIISLRTFDTDSQRSEEEIDSLTVLPVRETLPLSHAAALSLSKEDIFEMLRARAKELGTPPSELNALLEALGRGELISGLENLQQVYLKVALTSVLAVLPSDTLVVFEDELGMWQAIDALWDLIDERSERLENDHFFVPTPESAYLHPEELKPLLRGFSRYSLDHLKIAGKEGEEEARTVHIQSYSNIDVATRLKTQVGSGKALEPLRAFIERWRKDDMRVAFVVGARTRAERLHRMLLDLGYDARLMGDQVGKWLHELNYPMAIFEGHLASGFQLPKEKLVFIAEAEVFAERSYRKSGAKKTSLKKLLNTLSQLQENDYVVHQDYGVGVYKGLRHIEIEGEDGDFLQVDYADSTLYLPAQNIGKIQKFVAAEGQQPHIDKLSSTRWTKTKQKVREAVVELAGDLIKLYATRSVAKGWRFDVPGAEDERFADTFPYNETPDQAKAIEDALADMAQEKPMDRLVCGDVGFGKTEVAIRAAYKCLQHARQVAVLVPTTILAEQHRANFVERFKGYPFVIGAVSRYYDAQKNKETLEKLANGEIDVVIGTHKLLQRDVVFKDLGLVIIDEEHRFGVKQKEKLKSLKTQVDVLTLTATPIPRTLHMSLLGIRDISVISSPPQDRRVIRTYTAPYSDTLVRDAILRELQRGGQVFYVHNKVQDIDVVTAKLAELVPEARFVFGHGQMNEHGLETIMGHFLKKDADVLVCTTIVESGIDIPNANTIIIDRADTFGLAQLYQLRGRVGRSKSQAYAYLLVPKVRKMTAEAQQRLKALQSIDDLGLGFNLAVRDLEIRGAGNLLGKEQSGNVLAVGFDLYTKILREAVMHLKGEDPEPSIDPEVKLGVQAFIPDYYIPDVAERLVMYQRLASVDHPDEMQDLSQEMQDRFGSYGREVDNLIELMRFRALLKQYGVVKAEINKNGLVLALSPQAKFDVAKIMKLTSERSAQYKFGKNLTLTVTLDFDRRYEPFEIYALTNELFALIGK